jgi:hypothetical protein
VLAKAADDTLTELRLETVRFVPMTGVAERQR